MIWILSLLLAALSAITVLLYRRQRKREADLLYFLGSLQNGDFSARFTDDGRRGLAELHREFNRIIAEFKERDCRAEENYHFLKFVVNHLDVLLIVSDCTEKVHLTNVYTVRQFGLNEFYELGQAARFSEKMYQALKTDEEHLALDISTEKEHFSFILHQSVLILDGKPLKLTLGQNISSELESREFDAQNALMRILTHEIMNSIAPITSLASTTGKLAEKILPSAESEDKADILAALQAIEKRGNGLFEFVQSYRNLNSLPSPNFRLIDLTDLIRDVLVLMKVDLQAVRLIQNTACPVRQVLGDSKLLEQVLINLLKNSLDSLGGCADGEIVISLEKGNNSRPQLTVADNGRGISAGVLPKIFTPFFSTKNGGSGIGLTLCRQIIKLHKGSISAYSDGVCGAKFIIRF